MKNTIFWVYLKQNYTFSLNMLRTCLFSSLKSERKWRFRSRLVQSHAESKRVNSLGEKVIELKIYNLYTCERHHFCTECSIYRVFSFVKLDQCIIILLLLQRKVADFFIIPEIVEIFSEKRYRKALFQFLMTFRKYRVLSHTI